MSLSGKLNMMSYKEFIVNEFEFDLDVANTFSDNKIIEKCIQTILSENGMIHIMIDDVQREMVSPYYRFALNTLLKYGIVKQKR